MSSLYELTAEYQALLMMAEEEDTDEQAILDTMEGLEGEIEDKAQGYACVMRQISADIEAVKAEIDRLKKRKETMENNITNMKKVLQYSMEAVGKTKFKTPLFSFGIQNNPPSVVLDEQYIENIPEEYLIPQEPKIDRQKIKEDIKAGKDLEGLAHLEQTQSLRIK